MQDSFPTVIVRKVSMLPHTSIFRRTGRFATHAQATAWCFGLRPRWRNTFVRKVEGSRPRLPLPEDSEPSVGCGALWHPTTDAPGDGVGAPTATGTRRAVAGVHKRTPPYGSVATAGTKCQSHP